jgi:predicted Zn-dependent protease with MMP-like domain
LVVAAVVIVAAGIGPAWLRGAIGIAGVAAVAYWLISIYRNRRRALVEYASADALPDDAAPDDGAVFERLVANALETLPQELRGYMSNVAIVVEDEPPYDAPLLGLYQGVPRALPGNGRGGLLPDKISIYRGPIERLSGGDANRLEQEVRHVVLHEVAHHFGISDERLIEIDRY